jgi:hypothetical protein
MENASNTVLSYNPLPTPTNISGKGTGVGPTLQEAALMYAIKAWPVFRLKPRDKVPMPGSNGFKDATTDADVLMAWWRTNPNFNVGLRTGIAFDVFDIDGQEGIDRLRRRYGPLDLTVFPSASTGKGIHLYVAPTGYPIAGNLLGENEADKSYLDFRGEGGYAAAPPSWHPDGHQYTWRDEPGLDIPKAPDWMIDVLEYKKRLSVASAAPEGMDRYEQMRNGRPNILQVAMDLGMAVYRDGSRRVKVVCPYHDDHNPSMSLFMDNQTFRCWSCDAKGDSIDLQKGTKANF